MARENWGKHQKQTQTVTLQQGRDNWRTSKVNRKLVTSIWDLRSRSCFSMFLFLKEIVVLRLIIMNVWIFSTLTYWAEVKPIPRLHRRSSLPCHLSLLEQENSIVSSYCPSYPPLRAICRDLPLLCPVGDQHRWNNQFARKSLSAKE